MEHPRDNLGLAVAPSKVGVNSTITPAAIRNELRTMSELLLAAAEAHLESVMPDRYRGHLEPCLKPVFIARSGKVWRRRSGRRPKPTPGSRIGSSKLGAGCRT